MPAGRPTKYDPKINRSVERLCLLGATDKQIADFLEISEATLNNWKQAHPGFLESIKRGKEEADSKVANALYKRALGFEHPEVHIAVHRGHVIQTKIKKKYPPETIAAIFWLKNRQPDQWKDKQIIKHEDLPDPVVNVNVVQKKSED